MYDDSITDSNKATIVKSLIGHSKNGGNSAFLNLIKLFIDDIYKASFKLTLSETSAQKLSSDAVLEMQQNIQSYDVEIPIKRWIIHSVVNTYIQKKHEFLKSEPKSAEQEDYNALEKNFLSLPVNERIILCLYLELNYTEKEIIEKFPGMVNEDIDEIIRRNIPLLASSIEDEKIQALSAENWNQIVDLRKIEDNDNKLSLFLELRDLISSFEHFKNLLFNSFPEIMAPPGLVNKIRGAMIESLHRQAKIIENDRKKEERRKAPAGTTPSRNRKAAYNAKSKTRKSKKIKEEGAEKDSSKLKYVFIVLGVIIVAAAVSSYFLFFKGVTNEIRNVIGMYQVNGIQSSKKNVTGGDIVLTNSSSELVIDFEKHGLIKLNENSSLQVLSNTGDKLRVRLIKGRINCNFHNPSNRFDVKDELKIEMTAAEGLIKTTDSELNIVIEQSTPFKIDVIDGYVKVTDRSNLDYHMGAGYTVTQKQTRLTIPFNRGSKAGLIEILKTIGGNISVGQLKNVLNQATEKDLLSLWHLIPRSSSFDRGSIITKINEFAFLPYEEIERKATQLNTESLIYVLNLLMINYL